MLIFSILFMLMLWGASGHKITLKFYHYLIALFAIISILLLFIFPRISLKKNNLKFITGLSALVLLLVSLYYAGQNLYSILTENLIIGFKTVATIFVGIFIGTIIYLIKQIILELKLNKTE
ncbi:MAG: hypothetical protein COW66_07360 [Flavobacteriaceae bacterium CG18_big_fil_WC_8_21_14_2_50_34_36]|nr:MAG: hypothetical protein COW66_07360 [Flavobacteriaceae bacterium CG18_big_fil_WC_8_21_14_2_50_34_36]